MSDKFIDERNAVRTRAKAARRAVGREYAAAAADSVCDRLRQIGEYADAECVMIYLSALGELDTHAIAEDLSARGKTVAVPYTDTKTHTITPCVFEGYDKAVKGAYDILSPARIIPVEPAAIGAVIVPGVAFDTAGGRLGFGAGYYDRFLCGINAVKIGVCYECQIAENTYQAEHDIAMDYIVTERRLIRCGKNV